MFINLIFFCQILDVDECCDICIFVEKNDFLFKVGCGFYEFIKLEKVLDKKEVVLVDKVLGDMFIGFEVCDMIGVGGVSKIKLVLFEKWCVFVQSMLYNWVFMFDIGFLYEVDIS